MRLGGIFIICFVLILTASWAYSSSEIKEASGGRILPEAVKLEEVDEAKLAHICDLRVVSCTQSLGVYATVQSIEDIITEKANEYGVDPDLMLAISWCESRNNPDAKNLYSTAGGLFQYLDSTFLYGCALMGWDCELKDKFNPYLNAEMTAFFIRRGELSRWNESRACWQ